MRRCLAMGADRGVRSRSRASPIAIRSRSRERSPRWSRRSSRTSSSAASSRRTRCRRPRARRSPSCSAFRVSLSSRSSITTRCAEGPRRPRARGRPGRRRRGGYAGAAHDPDRHQRAPLRDPARDQAGRAEGDRGVEPGDLGEPAARVRRMFVPPKGEGAEMLNGSPEESPTDRGDRQGAADLMAGVLVVAEHLRGQVRDVTLELMTAAKDARRPGHRRRDRA